MPRNSRRAFLTGRSAVDEIESAGARLTDAALGEEQPVPPGSGDTVRVETKAMACTWQVMLNPGPPSQVMHASDALDLVHHLESLMTVYREDGQLAIVNRDASKGPVGIDPYLTRVLARSFELSERTAGAFDITGGSLVRLWRDCRAERRVPSADEIAAARDQSGVDNVTLDVEANTVAFDVDGMELNLGAIGKGFALDCAAEFLVEQGVEDFLIHGGASSVLARGVHAGEGWPVGVKNPLLNERSMATVLLGDADVAAGRALGTSGGNVQYFRLNGRRYGHILDPRTGQPADGLLSASVVAADATTADALSTAAFVAGREAVMSWCESGLCAGALVTPPATGRNVVPEVCHLAPQSLFFSEIAGESPNRVSLERASDDADRSL